MYCVKYIFDISRATPLTASFIYVPHRDASV